MQVAEQFLFTALSLSPSLPHPRHKNERNMQRTALQNYIQRAEAKAGSSVCRNSQKG